MDEGKVSTIGRELGGRTTAYDDVDVRGDRIERLLTELFTEHWATLTVGPLIEGAAYEIQFASPPKVTMLDGYLTVDTGAWHFHLCVNDHRGTRSEELARIRRVPRAAFFRWEAARTEMDGEPAGRRLPLDIALRVGLTDRIEVTLDGEPFVRIRGEQDDTGNGDVSLKGKYRFLEKREGTWWPSLGVLPFVKLAVAHAPHGPDRPDFGLIGLA